MGKRKKERSLSVRLSGIEKQKELKIEKIGGDFTERDRDREGERGRGRFAEGKKELENG